MIPDVRICASNFLHSILIDFPVAPKKYLNLPLGSVKPTGWLNDQARLIVIPFCCLAYLELYRVAYGPD